MGKYDGLMGRYFSNRERFADLMNGIVFDGRQVIDPQSLEREAGDYIETEQIVEADKKKEYGFQKSINIKRRYRDLKMQSNQDGLSRIFALENQSVVDYTMPLRCMEYDFLEYQEQINNLKESYKMNKTPLQGSEKLCGIKKKDRILPVYTVCLYHGEEEWDGPRSLFDMIGVNDKNGEKKIFSDYPMRLYCINEQQNFQVFHTEVRQFFQALFYRKDKAKLIELIENSAEYKNLSEETFEMIVKCLGRSELWKIRENFRNHSDEKEGYNMCQAIRELCEEERAIGREEGIESMILDNLEEHRSEETIIGKLVRWFSLTQEQAKSYYDKYSGALVR